MANIYDQPGMTYDGAPTAAVFLQLNARVDQIWLNMNLDTLTPGGLNPAGVAAAVRTELAVELARVDVASSTRLSAAAYTAPDNAGIANLPTLAEIEASTVLAKEATLAAKPTAAAVADAVWAKTLP